MAPDQEDNYEIQVPVVDIINRANWLYRRHEREHYVGLLGDIWAREWATRREATSDEV